MTDLDSVKPFQNRIRNIFWPIKKEELGKFVPIAALMFCILFNQNILRILKDSIVISEVSAEITSFAKVYCVTPVAALFVIIYAKLINHFHFDRIFYYLTIFFNICFVVFAFVIYPNAHLFHMNLDLANSLVESHPHFKWYILLFANWSYILFYTLSELWPNVFYVLLFWQFANEITTTNEAKRFYTLFSLFGNSALIVVGFIMMNLASETNGFKNLLVASDQKFILSKVSIFFVVIASVLSCLFIRYISNNVMTNPSYFLRTNVGQLESKKLTVIKSFKYIARSKYLWLILICSASFALSMNLVEAVWKSKIKELYPTVEGYAAFNGLYILWTGVVIIIMTIIGNNIMRLHNWFVAAVISPIVILITGVLFFIMVVFDTKIFSVLDGLILLSPLYLAVIIGAIQNVLSKGAKYSIWDTSTQMLYIPLDRELRTKGKAAVDVISPKIGKSSSGLVQSIIFTIMPSATFVSISPALMVIFILVCSLWIYSVRKIYLEYEKII